MSTHTQVCLLLLVLVVVQGCSTLPRAPQPAPGEPMLLPPPPPVRYSERVAPSPFLSASITTQPVTHTHP